MSVYILQNSCRILEIAKDADFNTEIKLSVNTILDSIYTTDLSLTFHQYFFRPKFHTVEMLNEFNIILVNESGCRLKMMKVAQYQHHWRLF